MLINNLVLKLSEEVKDDNHKVPEFKIMSLSHSTVENPSRFSQLSLTQINFTQGTLINIKFLLTESTISVAQKLTVQFTRCFFIVIF